MTRLVGHDGAVAAFREALAGGRLHHAWLLGGPSGVGKRLFAEQAAAFYLADGAGPAPAGSGLDIPEDHPTAKLIAAGSHPDLLRLEREVRENGTDTARNITVDQVRRLGRLFAMTPTFSPRRVIIIDSLDDLERGAANALLKHLEEPPADSLFLLVSHAPDSLLPTIRSRCRLLRFSPLGDDAMTSALHDLFPEAPEPDIKEMVAAGAGAPGRAVAFRGLDILALVTELRAIAAEGDASNARRAALAQSLSGKAAQLRYEAFLALAPSIVADAARQKEGPALAQALDLWDRARNLARAARRLSLDPQTTAFELAGIVAALASPPGSGAIPSARLTR